MSLREAARRTRRDVKAIHADVHALLQAGILDKDEAGCIARAARESAASTFALR